MTGAADQFVWKRDTPLLYAGDVLLEHLEVDPFVSGLLIEIAAQPGDEDAGLIRRHDQKVCAGDARGVDCELRRRNTRVCHRDKSQIRGKL